MAAAETKREAILRAASGLFLRHGLRGTSMEAIARKAGVAKPTLYAYFPDKNAVFKDLVADLIASWRADFLSALRGDGEVAERIGWAVTVRHKATMRLLAGSPHAAELYSGRDGPAGPELTAFDAEMSAAIEAELAAAGAARPRLITQMLLAASFGIGQRAQSPAELGPALRLLAERLIRPELP